MPNSYGGRVVATALRRALALRSIDIAVQQIGLLSVAVHRLCRLPELLLPTLVGAKVTSTALRLPAVSVTARVHPGTRRH